MTDNEKQTMEQEVQDTVLPEEEAQEAKVQAAGEALDENDEMTEETCEQDSEADAAEDNGEPKSWADKRAAKKQAKQDKKSDEYKVKIAELEDRAKRQLAEFENFRRRSDKEKQAMFETGAKSVIEKILPVIDNFERGFATVEPEDEKDAFVEGMRMVYKQMMNELEKIDVKPIEAVGKEFDPALHNAVMQVQSEEYEPGIVAQELQKGYTYRDTVVRYSMVAVVSE